MFGGKCREVAMAHTLVPSDHVETASVYGRGDEKIGTIERLMLEKKSGTVAYAVVRCGGLLRGEVRHYPVISLQRIKHAIGAVDAVLIVVDLDAQPTARERMVWIAAHVY